MKEEMDGKLKKILSLHYSQLPSMYVRDGRNLSGQRDANVHRATPNPFPANLWGQFPLRDSTD